ncbi:hypothetical protein ACIF8W_00430 [Streptomyces sp. NPDC085639]|uniref:hypothetical protein n=1 Tax=Streptomyces sp. NPDC085639 TaxID=3365734 RepID=UPI0037D927E8
MYPDAVTLEPGVPAERVLLGVDTDSPGCSVKDSFADLDLAGAGFEVLFEAQWIHRPAGTPLPPAEAGAEAGGPEWSEVTDAAELAGWEAASGGVFRPELLGEGIVFLAGRAGGPDRRRGRRKHRRGRGRGVQPVRSRLGGGPRRRRRAVPGLDVVGYEHGEDLEAAVRAGFTPIGPVRVWLRAGGGDHASAD